jgi:uncharacterized cupredoxin-like copper-binding protein
MAIDWDRKGGFDGQYDDVTGLTIMAQWFLGERKPYQEAADESKLSLILNNADRRFSPEYGSSPLAGKLTPFKPVRIQSYDGSTPRTHWIGWIESIQPKVNIYGERTVEITAAGPMQFCKATETALELQENMRTDQIITRLIEEVVIPPALVGAWVLGRVGNSELGRTTRLADVTQYATLDAGITTLAIAADNWVQRGGSNDKQKDTFDVYRAIKDVVAAERGRFLYSREGKALFWNRHHLLQGGETSVPAFNDTMKDLAYQYAGLDEFKNEVCVVCHPRAVSDSDQYILWQLADKVKVAPGESKEITVKFQDESENRISAKNVTVTDVVFSKGSASITLDVRASSAVLKITNDGTRKAVLTSCLVRGRKITDFGQMEAKEVDAASIIDYGRRSLRLNLPSVDNFEDAQYIAQFELHRRSQPHGAVSTLSLSSHGKEGGNQHAHQLARTLGDKITIKENQTGHGSSMEAGAANLIRNGGFTGGEMGWSFAGGIVHSVSGGKLHVYRNGGAGASFYRDFAYEANSGDQFTVAFKVANPSAISKTIRAIIHSALDYEGQAWQEFTLSAGAGETTQSFTGTVSAHWSTTRVEFAILTDDNAPDLTIDDIVVTVGTPYYIIGEEHKLSAGATLYETTWHLEPAPTAYPWKLGVVGRSELGEVTILTY